MKSQRGWNVYVLGRDTASQAVTTRVLETAREKQLRPQPDHTNRNGSFNEVCMITYEMLKTPYIKQHYSVVKTGGQCGSK